MHEVSVEAGFAVYAPDTTLTMPPSALEALVRALESARRRH
jgi:hypothetical protein